MADSSTGRQITVMVVDDHPMWRDGVDAAERIARTVRPDVVLMDMQLGTGSGVDATTKVLACSAESKVLVLSASGEQSDVLDAVKAGASGYLVKSAAVTELVEAVQATAAGQAVFTPGLAGLVLGEYRRMSTAPEPEPGGVLLPQLSERETEVLRLVAKGLSAKQIALRRPTTGAEGYYRFYGRTGEYAARRAYVHCHGVAVRVAGRQAGCGSGGRI